MSKKVKALDKKLDRLLMLRGDILAVELILVRLDNDPKVIVLAQDYIELMNKAKVKVALEYNKALGEL